VLGCANWKRPVPVRVAARVCVYERVWCVRGCVQGVRGCVVAIKEDSVTGRAARVCCTQRHARARAAPPVTSSLEQLLPSVLNRNRLLFCGHAWSLQVVEARARARRGGAGRQQALSRARSGTHTHTQKRTRAPLTACVRAQHDNDTAYPRLRRGAASTPAAPAAGCASGAAAADADAGVGVAMCRSRLSVVYSWRVVVCCPSASAATCTLC
jgi:hypothetical protein